VIGGITVTIRSHLDEANMVMLRLIKKTEKAGKAIFNKPVHRIHRITISHNKVRSIHLSLIKLQRLSTTSSHLLGR
jgi:hypothetical protein